MDSKDTFPPHAIAIVGMAGRFPDAQDLDGFWRNIREGVESLETFSDEDLREAGVDPALSAQPHYVRRGTVLQDAEHFDAAFFGMSPREAQVIDPQQRIFLECAWEALEHAGYAPGAIDAPVGVYAGASMNSYLLAQILRNPKVAATVGGYQLMLGNDKDFLCTRVSYKLDLHGPSMTLQTACSTSLVAVQVACRALERHECDIALAGGVSVSYPQRGGYLYQEGMILSPDGHCRPFDADAKGTRPGAGAGIVVLKRLADALADGDTVHAVIRGAAINNDGSGKAGYTAPSVDGQVEVIATAQILAGVQPHSIGYIEAHGTATPLGDPIEIAALKQVFASDTDAAGHCRLGSLKANLGHLDAAAGVAGLIKTVLVLKHRELPPLVNFQRANPQLDLANSPFTASAEVAPWPAGETPRRAGVSSFGIGGTNAHVVLEEAPEPAARDRHAAPHLVVLSARSEAALASASQRLAAHLHKHPGEALADVAWTLQVGRRAFAHRRAVVAGSTAELAQALEAGSRPPVHSSLHEGGERPVAFLFSGQGSQFAGMGAGLYETYPVYRDAVDRCAVQLQATLGRDLRDLLFATQGDTTINETRYAQPALFVTEYALAMLWQSWGVRPAAMLGHSIGEYVAAHLAGVMTLADALTLVAARGRLMQSMAPGAMAAVHMDKAELKAWLGAHAPNLEIAAVNAPGLCAIAGPRQVMDAALVALAAQGVEAQLLHTSHAFHSSMMDAVLTPFTDLVAQRVLSAPVVPYVSNVTGQWITAEQATSPAYYAEHLRSAVLFEAGVRTLGADASLHLLEVGPGRSLSTLAGLSLGPKGVRRVVASLGGAREPQQEARALLEAAGRLWLAGAALDASGMHAGHHPRRIPLPTYAFERQRHVIEAAPGDSSVGVETPASPSTSRASRDSAEVTYRADVGDWLYAPTWVRAPDNRAPGLKDTWLIAGGEDALATALAQGLQAMGADVVRASTVQEAASAVSEARANAQRIEGAFSLWGLRADAGRDALYHLPVALANALAPRSSEPVRLVVATMGAHSVLGEPVRCSEAALAMGPVLAMPLELPGLRMRQLDLPVEEVDKQPMLVQALIDEATTRDHEDVVARRMGQRWLRRMESCPLPRVSPDQPLLSTGAVVVMTGGLGGMGLAIAQRLAQRHQARLLLTARTALPARAEWAAWRASHDAGDRTAQVIAALQSIEAAGGEVEVACADAADASAMAEAIETARRRWGRIDALIHAAGVAGEGTLATLKSTQAVDAVLAPKVDGLGVLRDLLANDALECVVLMGSINAVLGAPGVSDYASANAVLDAFAESNEVPPNWRRVLAFDWGAWREVGMAARLEVPAWRRAAWDAYLAKGIGTEQGLDAFERVMASALRRAVVVPYDLPAALALTRAAVLNPAHAQPDPAQPQDAATATSDRAAAGKPVAPVRTDDVQGQVAAIWMELLGLEQVVPEDDFFQLGGHSLLATRVLARVRDSMGVQLALRDMFDASTLQAFAARVQAGLSGTESADDDREEIEF
ncbi:MAG: SDR family NAD(P)-dependent oxidoreductase [Hydrogenophaga sp.]|uniref:type I polyketide synthase n=1 Tax=Hydrogenophaga sp. TaxID=1904254 RepID=UPI001D2E29F8|nr:type I polyketide synthase [Hydrogenophaga sp.]MBX3611477.1 SDR family NAD(P)-dependent oxidoreductase [Hydrogenophaga sp.]